MNATQVTPMVDRSNNVIGGDLDGSRCSSPVGSSVVADEFLKAESQSPVIVLDQRRFLNHHVHFKVCLRREELVSIPGSNLWPLSMEVATECRMQNVECSMVSSASMSPSSSSRSAFSPPPSTGSLSLVFTTTRPIEKGQRLFFWFSEALLARLEMPFLVPKNIQAGDRYVCHRCSSIFTTPNPLKLHLFFNCSQRNVTPIALWHRVFQTLIKTSTADQAIGETALFQKSVVCKPTAAHLFLSPFMNNHPHRSPATNPAQVETIVSHLGRSKHGHICIYCGKIYSRKYGLKIHIRTHTGYKPLKCPVCARPFGDPSNLNKHIRLHAEHQTASGETPYKCELCGKVLVRRRDLDRHIQSRHSSVSSNGSRHQPNSSDSIDCPSPLSSGNSSRDSSSNNNSGREDSDEDDDQLDVVDIC